MINNTFLKTSEEESLSELTKKSNYQKKLQIVKFNKLELNNVSDFCWRND